MNRQHPGLNSMYDVGYDQVTAIEGNGELAEVLNEISFVLGVVGAIPVFLALQEFLRGRVVARRLLRFTPREPLDLVLSTNAFEKEKDGVAVSLKTAVGELYGTATIAGALGRYYPKKQMRAHLSKKVQNTLDGDLVILGGPLHNEVSENFIEAVNKCYDIDIVLDPANRRLKLGTHYDVDAFDVKEDKDHMPRCDVALILLVDNVWSARGARALLCGGLTTYGTAASADYIFRTQTQRAEGRRLRHVLRSNQSVAMVVKVLIQDWRVSAVTPDTEPIPLRRIDVAGREAYNGRRRIRRHQPSA